MTSVVKEMLCSKQIKSRLFELAEMTRPRPGCRDGLKTLISNYRYCIVKLKADEEEEGARVVKHLSHRKYASEIIILNARKWTRQGMSEMN